MNPIRPEMASHPLSQAAREVNAYADTHGLEETCEHYDLRVEDLQYVAEQRALRALYAQWGVNLNSPDVELIGLTYDQVRQHVALTAAYMDGLTIGWRAREIKEAE